jgi:branched-chain amino acid transport system permease protein
MIYVQVLVDGIIIGLMFALVAMGLSLIYGVMNIVNFAHGEFMMLAMFLSFFLWNLFGIDPIVSLVPVAAALFAFGILIYRALTKHIVGQSMISQVFATFGLMIFLQAFANFLWKANIRTVNDSISTGFFQVGQLFFSLPEVVSAGGAVVAALGLFWFLNRTETGLALQATAEDYQAAKLMGINTDRMFALAWGLSAGAVAIAGGLLASHFAVNPQIGARWVLPAFVAVAIGGFGNVTGAFWGGIIVGVVQVYGGFLTDPSLKNIFPYALFLLVAFFRPYGLLGRK